MKAGFVKPYTTQRDKPARCNEGPLASGSKVFLIQYPNGKYYYFCYATQASALRVMDRLDGSKREMDYNATSDPDNCLYSSQEIQ